MKKAHVLAAMAVSLLAATSVSLADAPRRDPGVTARQHHQRDRMQQQNQASRRVDAQKHDAQERAGVPLRARDPGVNARQTNQAARIAGGVKAGELTRAEAQELRIERRDIRQTERDYRSDGVLTRDERSDLHQELNQQSREIYEEKHDEDVRPQP